jgi:hypothetical protein
MADDECLELKNIKYKTMLLNNNIHSKSKENVNDIDAFLEKDRESIKSKSWSKLSNASKLQKLLKFAEKYAKKNNLNEKQLKQLKRFLIESMEKKKLQRIKDVTYDMKNNVIINIQGLSFNNQKKRFTLKSKDKKTSTLKSLPPLKKKKKKRDKTKKDKLKMDKIENDPKKNKEKRKDKRKEKKNKEKKNKEKIKK